MKNLLIAATALSLLGTSAMAFDIGSQAYLDSTVDVVYSVEQEDFTAEYELELGADLNDSFTVYGVTTVDIRDPDFTGLEIGVDYTAPMGNLVLTSAVLLDPDVEYVDVELRASLSF